MYPILVLASLTAAAPQLPQVKCKSGGQEVKLLPQSSYAGCNLVLNILLLLHNFILASSPTCFIPSHFCRKKNSTSFLILQWNLQIVNKFFAFFLWNLQFAMEFCTLSEKCASLWKNSSSFLIKSADCHNFCALYFENSACFWKKSPSFLMEPAVCHRILYVLFIGSPACLSVYQKIQRIITCSHFFLWNLQLGKIYFANFKFCAFIKEFWPFLVHITTSCFT